MVSVLQNGKVAFSGRVSEEITIPAGTKLLAFHGEPEEGSRQPDIRLVTVTYDDNWFLVCNIDTQVDAV